MTAEDIGFLNISELGERYRDGRLTPLDVVRFAQERLRQLEPSLNAFAHPHRVRRNGDGSLLLPPPRSSGLPEGVATAI